MKTSNFTVQVLQPSEGMLLTQSADIDLKNRVFSKKVFLSVNDSPDNWKEITTEEAGELKAQKEALIAEEQLAKELAKEKLAKEQPPEEGGER